MKLNNIPHNKKLFKNNNNTNNIISFKNNIPSNQPTKNLFKISNKPSNITFKKINYQ